MNKFEKIKVLSYEEIRNLSGWKAISGREACELWMSDRQDFILYSIAEEMICYGGEPVAQSNDWQSLRRSASLIQENYNLFYHDWYVFEDERYSVLFLDSAIKQEIVDDGIFCYRCKYTHVSSEGDLCKWCS